MLDIAFPRLLLKEILDLFLYGFMVFIVELDFFNLSPFLLL